MVGSDGGRPLSGSNSITTVSASAVVSVRRGLCISWSILMAVCGLAMACLSTRGVIGTQWVAAGDASLMWDLEPAWRLGRILA